jgi:UDP-2,3-diacylglucosamine hydrolase
MISGKKIYFASDLHLGIPDREGSVARERKFIRWLDSVSADAAEIHLLGDVFDFWFEYKHSVPRGHVRLLGRLAELCDSGLPIYWHIGNHDMWIFDYIPDEVGVEMIYEPIVKDYNGKTFYLAHGDGLGPGDRGYKMVKKIFRNRLCQWLFARLHPNFGISLANYFSRGSRASEPESEKTFQGEENEWLVIHSKSVLETQEIDFFVYGHRHIPLDIDLGKGSRYINLGDWIHHFSYAVFDGETMSLKYFKE